MADRYRLIDGKKVKLERVKLNRSGTRVKYIVPRKKASK